MSPKKVTMKKNKKLKLLNKKLKIPILLIGRNFSVITTNNSKKIWLGLLAKENVSENRQ